MKIFKKIILVVMFFSITLLFTGCGNKNVEGTLEDIMAKVYENIPENERPMMLENTEVDNDNVEYFFGTTDINYKEALASESGIGSIAHSVVLVRAKEDADVEEIKTKIKENVNPRKWICVGVEDDDVIIKSKGDLIILIVVEDEDTRTTLEEGFDNL